MKVLLGVILFYSQLSGAAVRDNLTNETVVLGLRRPHALAVQAIKTLGEAGLQATHDMALSEKWPLKTRWKAFMVYCEIQGKKSLLFIEKALDDKTWYMRSAGLTALGEVDPELAKTWAQKILRNDPALMVRMKALEVLKQEKSESVTELFWEKMQSEDSWHRKQSLWIRNDIARILLEKPRKKDLKRWVGLLHGKDQEIQVLASQAMQKLHNNAEVQGDHLSFWKRKYPESKSL